GVQPISGANGEIGGERLERRSAGAYENLPGFSAWLTDIEDVLVPTQVSGVVLLDHIPESVAAGNIVVQAGRFARQGIGCAKIIRESRLMAEHEILWDTAIACRLQVG